MKKIEFKDRITEYELNQFGFEYVIDESYINGRRWLLQVSNDYVDCISGEIINKDGTWFDAIGTGNFKENGEMAVSTICRGNYVCKSVRTINELKALYFVLSGKELRKG